MKIGFWSPLHGTGATANLLAIAVCLAENEKKKVVVTQTHYEMNNMEKPLLGSIVMDGFFEETGMDALIRHFKSGYITNEQIMNCAIKVSDNLSLVAGTKANNRQAYETEISKNIVQKIVSQMENYCDVLLVDTNAGNDSGSFDVLEKCDVIVVTLRQNKDMVDAFFKIDFFNNKNVFFLIGNYDETSKYNLSNLRHLYKRMKKDNSGGIIHSTSYMDAISEDKVIRFFQNNILADDFYFEKSFVNEIIEISHKILNLAKGNMKNKPCSLVEG